MIAGILIVVVTALTVFGVLGYQIRSTPTHLVIQRRRRPTADKVILQQAQPHMDVHATRELEWQIYGRYYTALDGQQIPDGSPDAFAREIAQPEGKPCWCDFCKGRVGVHGPAAVALYKSQVEAAFARSRAAERQKIPRTVISAGRNVVISGDASGIIVAGGDVVINQGKPIEDLTPQDISNMTVEEFAELRRRMELLGYHSSDLHKRLTRGIFG